jgi:S-adenosylmethionine hydrolase
MKKITRSLLLLSICVVNINSLIAQSNLVVLQTDFGVKDGAVAAMKGVCMQVSRQLQLFDITHEIPVYNIWEAALRLQQTASYWPKGTVFVSVVDPGVGSARKAVVVKTKSGYYFVGPDNGSFTFIAQQMGVAAVREINIVTNRLPGSESSYTFHGRDIFAYTAAKLAAGKIKFEQVGNLLKPEVTMLPYQQPVLENGIIKGTITILDVQYGNVWTNINKSFLAKAGIELNDMVTVKIYHNTELVYTGSMRFVNTFSEVADQQTLAYINSNLQFSVAVNMGSFAEQYKVSSGPQWRIEIKK